ncbi:MAG: hypothetical protein ACREE0_08960 [Phenylobacterium sp.]
MMSQLWNWVTGREWSDALIAGGTVVLAAVTALLALYTKRLADVTTRASVVATLEPSRWSIRHFDLRVENEGPAAAFNIQVKFDPPIDLHEVKEGHQQPLRDISILRSGQQMLSFVAGIEQLDGKMFTVTVAWSRKPKGGKRESVTYDFDMKSFGGMSMLGKDPAVQVAEEIKKLRELVQKTISGNRLTVDTFSSDDRERREREIRAHFEAQRATPKAVPTPQAAAAPKKPRPKKT